MGKIEIIVGVDGRSVRHIYADDLVKLTDKFGEDTEIKRASYVEPTEVLGDIPGALDWLQVNRPGVIYETVPGFVSLPSGWWADMRPSGGPILGHFRSRQEALDAELAWLSEHHLPQPTNTVSQGHPHHGDRRDERQPGTTD